MKKIDEKHGFVKMYWDLFYDVNLTRDAVMLMSYILAIYPTLKKSMKDENGVEYKLLTDSFINDRIWDMSSHEIRKAINVLIEQGYITRYGGANTKLPRYIHINECVNEGINDNINECINDSVNECINDGINEGIKNFNTKYNNIYNNKIDNNISIDNNIMESGKPDSNGSKDPYTITESRNITEVKTKLDNFIANNNWKLPECNRQLFLDKLMVYSGNIDKLLERHTGASTTLQFFKDLTA